MTAQSSRPGRIRKGPREIFRPSLSRPSSAASDRVAIMKREFTIDPRVWVAGFTMRHPGLVVRALNIMAVAGGDLIGEFEVYGQEEDWTREIGAFPDVVEVERLARAGLLGRYRVRLRASPLFKLEMNLEVVVRLPTASKNGVASVELIARVSRLRALMRSLRDTGREPRLNSLAADAFPPLDRVLTPAQSAIFRTAHLLGYFDVPRRITLTQLAEKVSRSKSSVSEILAVAERKLVEGWSAAYA
jgi:hypothetical protein